ncbi:50S ribosomal protein L11 methyltransferase [Candidatus Pacearchaeota archaeon]|nr:50S ribosomal protein L11 methyltransferase [Candidatus Pacearchaeota archaeon]
MIPCLLEQCEKRNFQDIDYHTQALFEQMCSANNPYTADYRGIELIVYPRVFFPLPYSSQLRGITKTDVKNYSGKRVLDVGSGTGIRSIVAGLSGAKKVVATDINENAAENTQENVIKYNLDDKIEVLESNLFDNVDGIFDIIIGYLPIVSHDVHEIWELAVFDPDYSIHRRFFREVKDYLDENGIIKMVHSSKGNLDYFEELIDLNDLIIFRKKSSHKFGLTWNFYDLEFK